MSTAYAKIELLMCNIMPPLRWLSTGVVPGEKVAINMVRADSGNNTISRFCNGLRLKDVTQARLITREISAATLKNPKSTPSPVNTIFQTISACNISASRPSVKTLRSSRLRCGDRRSNCRPVEAKYSSAQSGASNEIDIGLGLGAE